MPRVIFHVDMDAFYASVETKYNPDLKGKPVVIGADPKEGLGRGVVAACNYEARKLGVHSAMPISRAWRMAPGAVYLTPNWKLYGEDSDRVMLLLRGYADTLEQLGIDEAFLEVSKRVKDYRGAEELARRVKAEVFEKEKLTCSVGVAPSKSVAKIASDFKKPDGLTVVPPQHVKDFLAPLPVSKISGVGKKTEEQLHSFGIRTIGQLAVVPGKELVRIFGKNGIWLWAIANGLEETPVEERPPVKSISMEQTFEKDVADVKLVTEALLELSDEVHKRALTEQVLFRTVGIKVRFKHFVTFTREHSLQDYTQEKRLIIETVRSLFKEFASGGKEFRLVGVRLSNLKTLEAKQESLYRWAGPGADFT